jgi:hypothetical protein
MIPFGGDERGRGGEYIAQGGGSEDHRRGQAAAAVIQLLPGSSREERGE